jgi:4-hydroxy-3-polyprenylbenzoate decarboxylase
MRVHKVYARKNAIWNFTVVGRPPQEDTAFGNLIHELAGSALTQEIPGVKDVHAVDVAGVHPLLFAIGSERYTPYAQSKQPAEILTLANRILGTGQLSLAKFLFITATNDERINIHNEKAFLQYILERIDLRRDIHFQTNTTIDTLDYSGTALNSGSKVVFAAYGNKLRSLCTNVPDAFKNLNDFGNAQLIMDGVLTLQTSKFTDYTQAQREMQQLDAAILQRTSFAALSALPLIIICDDSDFMTQDFSNFLWATFTRCNPARDIYGIGSFTEYKHWGCNGSLIIDARIKPHHAPPLISDKATEEKVDKLFERMGVKF